MQVTHPPQVNQGRREEAPQADIHYQPALDHLYHCPGDHSLGLLDLLDPVPRPLILGTFLGENQPSFCVLSLQDQCLDLFTQRHHVAGIGVVANREFFLRDHALGLIANVDKDLVPVDPDHRAFHQLAVCDVDEGRCVGLL